MSRKQYIRIWSFSVMNMLIFAVKMPSVIPTTSWGSGTAYWVCSDPASTPACSEESFILIFCSYISLLIAFCQEGNPKFHAFMKSFLWLLLTFLHEMQAWFTFSVILLLLSP